MPKSLTWMRRWFVIGIDGRPETFEVREFDCAYDPEAHVFHVRVQRGRSVELSPVPESKAYATMELANARFDEVMLELRGNNGG